MLINSIKQGFINTWFYLINNIFKCTVLISEWNFQLNAFFFMGFSWENIPRFTDLKNIYNHGPLPVAGSNTGSDMAPSLDLIRRPPQ